MKIQTTRFGDIEVTEDALLTFPSGFVGFPAVQRFVVLDAAENSDYQWFQAVDEPSLALIIVDVHILQPDFQVDIPDEGLSEIEYTPSDPLMIMAVVTIPAGKPHEATANLRAPLVVNVRTWKGKQVILHETRPLRFPLLPAEAVSQPEHEVTPEPTSV